MIGGPETAVALGQTELPPAEVAQEAGEQVAFDTNMGLPPIMSNDGMGIPLDMLSRDNAQQMPAPAPGLIQTGQQAAQPSTQPAAQAQPQQRGGGGLGVKVGAPHWNQNYRYTQEDFYGKQRDYSFTDPRGVQLQVPNAARLPMSIWASRAQQVQGERLANQKKREAIIKGTQVKPTADPYQQGFTKILGNMEGQFIEGLAEQYNGNVDLAWDEIATNPETARKWAQLHSEAEAVGQYGKFIWDEAKNYLERSATGKFHVDPEMRKRAEEVFYGYGNLRGKEGLGDIRLLLKSSEEFHRAISREEWLKTQVLPDIKDRYQRWTQQPKFYTKNGQRVVEVRDTETLKNDFYKDLADELTVLIPGSTPQENERYLRSSIPQEHLEMKVQATNVPTDGGSGQDQGKTWAGAVERGVSSRVFANTTQQSFSPGETTTTGVKKGTVDRMPIGEVVGGRQQNMGARAFVDPNGNEITIKPRYVERDTETGGTFVTGELVNTSGETAQEVTKSEWTKNKDGTWTQATRTDRLPLGWVAIPVTDSNSAALDQYVGPQWRSIGGQPESQEKPPVEGARKAPDGNYYVPDPNRPGKYLRVQ